MILRAYSTSMRDCFLPPSGRQLRVISALRQLLVGGYATLSAERFSLRSLLGRGACTRL